MPDSFVDRRRAPRVMMPAGHVLQLPVSTTVQVVDISLSGMLVTSPHPTAPGQTAVLNTKLGAETLRVPVEVRRVVLERAAGRRAGRYRMGVRFASLDEATRRNIQRFLSEGEM